MLLRRRVQLAVVLLVTLLASSAPARRMAILELRGTLDRDSLVALTNGVRAAAVQQLRGGDISVLTRENMAVLLQDMGLDPDCVEGACEVETGRNLGAQLVVAGEVLHVQGKLLADLKLYETEGGTLLATERAVGDDELQLLQSLEPASAALFRHLSRSAGPAPPVQEGSIGEGDDTWDLRHEQRIVVSFSSQPAGAVVRLDGALLCQATPCSREIQPGPHEVLMEKERYHPASERRGLQRGDTVELTLAPRFGWLSARTDPPGLDLDINGNLTASWERKEVVPGVYEVLIADSCWKRQGERVVIDEGEEEQVVIHARARQAAISVRAQDEVGNAVEAEVRLDGRLLGRTPGLFKVPLCSRELVVSTSAGERIARSLSLQELEVEEIAVTVSEVRAAATRPAPGWGTAAEPAQPTPSVRSQPGTSAPRGARSSDGQREAAIALMVVGGFLGHSMLLANNGTYSSYLPPPLGTQQGIVTQPHYDEGREKQAVFLSLTGAGFGVYGLGLGLYRGALPSPGVEHVKRSLVLLAPAIGGFVVSGVMASTNPQLIATFHPFSLSAGGVGFLVGSGSLVPFLTVLFSHLEAKREGRLAIGHTGTPRLRIALVSGPASIRLEGRW